MDFDECGGRRAATTSPQRTRLLLELNRLDSELGQKATTDFDEIRAPGNGQGKIHQSVMHVACRRAVT